GKRVGCPVRLSRALLRNGAERRNVDRVSHSRNSIACFCLASGDIPHARPAEYLGLELNDGVTDADDTADEDVGVDSGPVGELLDDPRSRHLLEMPTRLAELHAEALDLADAKAFANKGVDIHIAHGHLPARITRP